MKIEDWALREVHSIEDWRKLQEDYLYNYLKGTPFRGDTPLEKANLLDKVSKRLREME